MLVVIWALCVPCLLLSPIVVVHRHCVVAVLWLMPLLLCGVVMCKGRRVGWVVCILCSSRAGGEGSGGGAGHWEAAAAEVVTWPFVLLLCCCCHQAIVNQWQWWTTNWLSFVIWLPCRCQQCGTWSHCQQEEWGDKVVLTHLSWHNHRLMLTVMTPCVITVRRCPIVVVMLHGPHWPHSLADMALAHCFCHVRVCWCGLGCQQRLWVVVTRWW